MHHCTAICKHFVAQINTIFRIAGRVNTQRRERLLWPICESFDGTQYSRWPDTHIPACLARLSAGQQSMPEDLLWSA